MKHPPYQRCHISGKSPSPQEILADSFQHTHGPIVLACFASHLQANYPIGKLVAAILRIKPILPGRFVDIRGDARIACRQTWLKKITSRSEAREERCRDRKS